MRRFIIILAVQLLLNSCNKIHPIVNTIAKANRVECEHIGFAGRPSHLYKKFEELKNIASKKELIDLIDHDSNAVVVYASYALIDRNLVEPRKLLEKYINTEESVLTFCGCIMGGETVVSEIYHRYWNNLRIRSMNNSVFTEYVLKDNKELQKMDSLILFSQNPDWILLSRAFENRVYSNEYKFKIEEWGFDKLEFYALEYIFKNLRIGNEEKLISSFNILLKDEKVYEGQKEKINLMMNELKKY